MDKLRIGFIGIGNMGWPMAANLSRAGWPLAVYDLDPAACRRFAGEFGGSAAADLRALGTASDAIITMLPTGQDVRRVVLEQDGGLAATLVPGSLLIDMSSSDPVGTRDVGKILHDRGMHFMDAPVSGGVPGAKAGSLTIMMGADDPATIERARPLLCCLGKRLIETGPLGAGHAMKSLNNFVAAAGFAAAAEALIVGKRFGLDPLRMLEVLNVSTGRNFSTESTMQPEVVDARFASGFALSLLAKDIGIAAALARALHVDAPVLNLCQQHWGEAFEALGPGRDFTEAFRFWEASLPDRIQG